MSIRSYRDLVVWQKSQRLAGDVYQLTATFRRTNATVSHRKSGARLYPCLATSLKRHGRETRGEFLNQLSVARGSANEVESLLLFGQQLGYGDQEVVTRLLIEIDQVLRMLARMRSRLREGRDRSP